MGAECRILDGSTWGLAYAWYPEYTAGRTDPISKMQFLSTYGMTAYPVSFEELKAAEESEREAMFQMIADHGFTVSPHFPTDHIFDDSVDTNRVTEGIIRDIERYCPHLNSRIVTTTLGTSYRYDRLMPFGRKVEMISAALSPIAKACTDAGAPLALENHADYYVREIVDIIVATPGLYLLFDTANALHIGEQPVKAAMDAAPYMLGTHFKDHLMIRGSEGPVHYTVSGCALGEGDAELEQVYRVVMEKCPNKDRLVMLFELFKGDTSAVECFEESVRFVRRLQDTYGH